MSNDQVFTMQRIRPYLVVLFVGSGCAGLIYEIVWFQMLQLVIGSSAVSLGVLLGTFMGGMCLGSILLPRYISPQEHPLRVYAFLELGIAAFGLVLLFGMPLIGKLYIASIGTGILGILWRGVICSVCLLPPTILMGATLPAIARWTETTREGVSWLGYFYGGNIVGAVTGCLLAGFYLLRVYDIATATYIAVLVNIAVGTIALFLAAKTPFVRPIDDADFRSHGGKPENRIVYLVIGLSGISALGAEVIWTRLLSLMLGATVYTFSIILAVFLLGLAIGSNLGAFLSRNRRRPGMALAWCQIFLTMSISWAAYQLSVSLPYWPIDPTFSTNPWLTFQLDVVRCLWAILPSACLWGASFPLALAAIGANEKDPGHLVGRVYAANTVGAIFGAFGFSVLVIGWLGTQTAQQILVGLTTLSAILMFVSVLLQDRSIDANDEDLKIPRRSWDKAIAMTAAAFFLMWSIPEVPRGLIAFGRNLPSWADYPEYVYAGEGMNASVAVSELDTGVRNFHVSGKVVASSEPQDMRLQRMLGHISALLHPHPRSILVVGCGAGVTAGTFVLYPEVERIVICEIEPLIPPAARTYFGTENYGVIDDPRVELVLDDARHYMATTSERFDVITSDPIHPWVKGAATLYSEAYFELAKKRLNPGGVISQWVPLYETTESAVKSQVATFLEVFPSGTVWGNKSLGEGYDIVLLGQTEETRILVDELQVRLDREDMADVSQSLKEVSLGSAVDLLATYVGEKSHLGIWMKDAEITNDSNFRLQYLAGMGLNDYKADRIYRGLLVYLTYPEDIFLGSGSQALKLRRVLEEHSNGIQ